MSAPFVYEQQFDVGGIAHLAAAELPQPKDGKPAWPSIRQAWGAELLRQAGLAHAQGLGQHDLGQVRERLGEGGAFQRAARVTLGMLDGRRSAIAVSESSCV